MKLGPLVPQSFYERDALDVAPELLGLYVRRDEVVLRITEVEAYRSAEDSACHARVGRTKRNAVMWGRGGHAYVYLCYGVHQMLNLVTNRLDHPSAVLVRACEPIAGMETIRARRGGKSGTVLLAGPGKVGAALAIDPTWSGHALFESGGLEVRRGEPPAKILVGPRVGIDYAEPKDRDAPWRFAIAGTKWVTEPDSLKPQRKRRSRST